jgi:hypothetical protein
MPPADAREHASPSTTGLRLAVLPGGKARVSQAPASAGLPTLTWRSRTPFAVAFGIAAMALVGWLATSRSSAAALRDLPAGQRARLAERTLANLRDVCHGPERPRDFCREQATLILRLPECDQVCREQARAVLVADSAVR